MAAPRPARPSSRSLLPSVKVPTTVPQPRSSRSTRPAPRCTATRASPSSMTAWSPTPLPAMVEMRPQVVRWLKMSSPLWDREGNIGTLDGSACRSLLLGGRPPPILEPRTPAGGGSVQRRGADPVRGLGVPGRRRRPGQEQLTLDAQPAAPRFLQRGPGASGLAQLEVPHGPQHRRAAPRCAGFPLPQPGLDRGDLPPELRLRGGGGRALQGGQQLDNPGEVT